MYQPNAIKMHLKPDNNNQESSYLAKWVCPTCNHRQITRTRQGNHPFGRVICEMCGLVPAVEPDDDQNELVQILGLSSLQGREYKISLPPGTPAPKTKFVWICCRCGVSHRDAPKAAKSHHSDQPEPPARKGWLDRADSFRMSFGKGKQYKLPVTDPRSNERPVYRLKFHHKCTVECKHRTCEACYRGVWKVEGEWLVRVYNDEDIAKAKLKHGLHR